MVQSAMINIGNTLPLVRLAEGTAKECKQVLDAGSGGVIVPMIKTAEQLEWMDNQLLLATVRD